MAADWLSKLGHSILATWSFTECDNLDFKIIVQDDRIGHTLVRTGT